MKTQKSTINISQDENKSVKSEKIILESLSMRN